MIGSIKDSWIIPLVQIVRRKQKLKKWVIVMQEIQTYGKSNRILWMRKGWVQLGIPLQGMDQSEEEQ